MKEIILLVEDLPEEQEKAKSALRESEFKFAVATTLSDAFRIWKQLEDRIEGVLTDIHFPQSTSQYDNDATLPCGLAVVAEAVKRGIPCVVVSDINHHYADYVENVLQVLESHQNYSIFGKIPIIMDNKDWDQAAEELSKMMKKRREI